MLLLIDNYDSFVHNLARYFERLGHDTRVVRNDAVDAAAVRRLRPRAIVLSPGPCTPQEAGASLEIVRELHAVVPILGVCLGHQVIGAAFGGRVIRAPEPVHGRASRIRHDGKRLFEGVPSPLQVGRYHSLIVESGSLSGDLRPTAKTDDGIVMAFEHVRYPVFGVQFHPESILTECGYEMLANFLRIAGVQTAAPVAPSPMCELRQPSAPAFAVPNRPVTF